VRRVRDGACLVAQGQHALLEGAVSQRANMRPGQSGSCLCQPIRSGDVRRQFLQAGRNSESLRHLLRRA
jgi:hypothetical protein